jgi:hypothetical protein
MRTLFVAAIVAASGAVNAADISIAVSNVQTALVDLAPADGIDPTLSLPLGDLAAFATGFSTLDTSMPVFSLLGSIGAHSEARVGFDFSLSLTVPNNEDAYAIFRLDSACLGSCKYPGWVGLNTGLLPDTVGPGFTTRTRDYHAELVLTNDLDTDGAFSVMYTHYFFMEKGSVPSPVPEPSTYLLMAAGLAAISFVRRSSRC